MTYFLYTICLVLIVVTYWACNRYYFLWMAVKDHHDQPRDDRCQLDDNILYRRAGLEKADISMPPKVEFLKDCDRYYDQRCINGNWPSHKELEDRLRSTHAELEALKKMLEVDTTITRTY